MRRIGADRNINNIVEMPVVGDFRYVEVFKRWIGIRIYYLVGPIELRGTTEAAVEPDGLSIF